MKKSMLKIALSILLVAVVLVGGTLAYLVTQTEILTNTFAVVDIDTSIVEDPANGTADSKEPYVQNNSNVPVYVRAIAVAVTEEGSSVPVSASDVTINYDYPNTKWVQQGDYYYYTEAVAPEGSTEMLFDGVEDIKVTAEGARFAVYVYHESVEAKELNVPENASAEQKASAIADLFQ